MNIRNVLIAFLIVVILGVVSYSFFSDLEEKERIKEIRNMEKVDADGFQTDGKNNQKNVSGSAGVEVTKKIEAPLGRVRERVTKKSFGILIDPKTSPVQPERFQGYHTGADFEIFPEELESDISVRAVCGGKIEAKRVADGYGGVLVESCLLDSQPVTIVYGHLKLASISKNIGDVLEAGEEIGVLGKNKSAETDGERKHLHLGIHKGRDVNLLGYVQTKKDLDDSIDPCLYFCD